MKMIPAAITTTELAQMTNGHHSNTVRMLKIVSEAHGVPLKPVPDVTQGTPYLIDSITALTMAARQNPALLYPLLTHSDAFKDVTTPADFKAMLRLLQSMANKGN